MTTPGPVVVVNPSAGGGRAGRRARDAVRALQAQGLRASLVAPSSVAEMHRELAALVDRGHRMLVACGGDGTVHQVLQAAVPSGSTMGIIPAGTGNDIARALGIPVRARDGWITELGQLISSGADVPVDVSSVTVGDRREWSLGVVSAGFDSAVNERADRMTRLRGTPRYVAALLAEMATFRLHDFRIRVGETDMSGRALLVAVGNGSSYGGGMRICPSAHPADGLLDVTWVSAAPRRTVLLVFPRIFSGRHVEHPLVRTMRGRVVEIEADGAMVYADGERMGPAPARVEVVPGGLRMLVPAGATVDGRMRP